MRDIALKMLEPGGLLITVVILLFSVNGYLERRDKLKKGKTITQGEVVAAQTEKTIEENPDIAERWKKYADDIEARLEKRIKIISDENQALIKALAEQTEMNQRHMSVINEQNRVVALLLDYIGSLRHHIAMRFDPPAPDWPPAYREALENIERMTG